jgi:ABC-type branched-subunit amino acid transport system permease subunit
MASDRRRDLKLDIWGVIVLLPLLVVPFAIKNVLIQSLTYQTAIGVAATMGIYVMLRMGLLSFSVPSFMTIGGYSAAILATAGWTDIFLLTAISFVIPALVAAPLGAVVLRLKGIYFIFITFIFNEILQILLFETPTLTGGSNGIAGIPPSTLFGHELALPGQLVAVTVVLAIVAALVTLVVTHRFRAEFTSIEENETLTESLGVAIWKYRTVGFIVSAGVSGLAGFALVNMLSTAHPSSFASWSVNNYIAYAFVGGRGTILGGVVGSALLIVMTNYFSAFANLSSGLFGVLLIVVMMLAPSGIVGSLVKLVDSNSARFGKRSNLSIKEKQNEIG